MPHQTTALLGQDYPGHRFGNFYYIDPDDITTPDDGYNTLVNGTTRLKRIQVDRPRTITPFEYGLVGDGRDEYVKFQQLLNFARTWQLAVVIPLDCNVGINQVVKIYSGAKIYGPGKITFYGVGSQMCMSLGDPYLKSRNDATGDIVDVVIDGVEFVSDVDMDYLHFISIVNTGYDCRYITIRNCYFNYNSPSIIGNDQWAIVPGGAGTIYNLTIENNRCIGRMQLTANGGASNLQDININNNVVIGGINACIALSRKHTNPDGAFRAWKRINICNNFLFTDAGIGVYVGLDSSDSMGAHSFEDVNVCGNFVYMRGQLSEFPRALFFRAPQRSNSFCKRITFANNTCYSTYQSIQMIVSNVEGYEAAPTKEMTIKDNICVGSIQVSGYTKLMMSGNQCENQVILHTTQGEVFNNNFKSLRVEGSGSNIESRNNIYTGRSEVVQGVPVVTPFVVNVNSAAGQTNTLRSVGDTFDEVGTVGATTAFRLQGEGTVVASCIDPIDAYQNWNNNFWYTVSGGHSMHKFITGKMHDRVYSLADPEGSLRTSLNARVGQIPTRLLRSTPLSANMTINLITTGATNNAEWHVTRTAGATGAYTIDVGGLASLSAGQWCVIRHDGSSFYLAQKGSLS